MVRAAATFGLALACAAAAAQERAPEDTGEPPAIGLHAQATYTWQLKPAFDAPYTGAHSLLPQREHSYSFTTTADLGVRLWRGAQAHLVPEGTQGQPLSALQGLGGLTNAELAHGSSTKFRSYRSRLFIQQRVDVGGEREKVDAAIGELGGGAAARRWTFVAGTISLADYFDPNPYAKDPRTQFSNSSFATHGAFDYAADARGYTTAVVAEYRESAWAIRAARALEPIEANGADIDRHWGHQHGGQLEVESDLPVRLAGGPLRGRALLFRNRILAGRFSDALALAGPGGVPDVALVRRLQDKTGWGLTLEAPLGEDEGLFLRASRNDGRLEEYTFIEVDAQVAFGGQFAGTAWGRPQDRWGAAVSINSISPSHRQFLAAGGLGFFVGDGRLNYGAERVFEAYYRWVLPELKVGDASLQSSVGAGWQHIANPGYNRDRGPVQVWTVRWHSEF